MAAPASPLAGSLSRPSKMPGFGYGLPALTSCKVGAKLARNPRSKCSKCYAARGRYRGKNVQDAQLKRMQSILDPRWVDEMVVMISTVSEPYFRWHDSGDLLSLDHLSKICEIAVRLPEYKFWLPTQEYGLVRRYLKTVGDFPTNLTVRLSTPLIDQAPATTDLCTSTVHDKTDPIGHACPSQHQGNKCRDCRACWDQSVKNVAYHLH